MNGGVTILLLSEMGWIVLLLFLIVIIIPSATCFQGPPSAIISSRMSRRSYGACSSSSSSSSKNNHLLVVRSSSENDKDEEKDDVVSSLLSISTPTEEYIVLEEDDKDGRGRREAMINIAAGGLLVASGFASYSLFSTQLYTPSGYKRISPIQFMAVLGDPNAKSSSKGNGFASSDAAANAGTWGLWTQDPGPRGVFLKDYDTVMEQNNGIAPNGGWKLNSQDFWLDEHGLIMESPKFPVKPGKYLVTGGRMVTTGLTIHADGNWELEDPSAKLYDVTHLPCRAARYKPTADENNGPQSANLNDFPVLPGAKMPTVQGCNKQDYAVLLVVGKAV